MEKSHSQAGRSQVKTIQGVDWGHVEKCLEKEREVDMSGIISVEMIMDHFDVKSTIARHKLRQLINCGEYEEHWVMSGNSKRLFAKPV